MQYQKILMEFRRKEKTTANFFDINKACEKINREKTLQQLEKMGIQGRLMECIGELISERCIKVRVGGSISQSKQTELEIPQREVLNITLFLVAINGIL